MTVWVEMNSSISSAKGNSLEFKKKANNWKMVLSLWSKAHVHCLQRNPSGSPSEPADCYFIHNSNRPGMVFHCIHIFQLDPVVRIKPSLSCIIKRQIPLSNLSSVTNGRVTSWKWIYLPGPGFAINTMGLRFLPHKLLGKLSYCMLVVSAVPDTLQGLSNQ